MESSALVKILRDFSDTEQKDFLHFLDSPYHTKGKNLNRIRRMCSYIFEHMHKEDAQTLLGESVVHTHVYELEAPSNIYNLSNRRSEAKKWIYEFYVQEQLRKTVNEPWKDALFARRQTEKNQLKEAAKSYTKLQKWLKGSRLDWNHADFVTAFNVVADISYYLSINNKQKDDAGLFDVVTELEHLYTHLKVHYSSLLLGKNLNTRIMNDEQRRQLEMQRFDNQSYIQSVHGKLKLLAFEIITTVTPTVELYESFKSQVEQHEKTLYHPDLMNYRVLLIHFILKNKEIFKGKYLPVIFDLIKREFEDDFPYSPTQITPSKFYACFNSGLRSGAFDWVRNFFMNYKNRIQNVGLKEETLVFCEAMLLFYEKKLEAAEELLSKINFTETNLKFLSRLLEIKILYELDSPILAARVEAAVRYFRRDEFSAEHTSQQLIEFGNILTRMMKPNFGFKKQFTARVLEDVETNINVPEKNWLRKVIGEALTKCKE